ncbi:MAG: pyrroline-5-carboxylate reductase [Alphaproteobacteria bacterium]|nr:pyrroline-5-carboxylate reductase [Alphaproteobacteria bacterium]
MSSLDAPRVVLVGAGQMGGALVRGWVDAVRRGGGLELTVLEPNFDQGLAQALESVGAVLNPPDQGAADIVVFAVKPQTFAAAAESARGFIGPGTIVLSVMAGLSIADLSRTLGVERIVRAMPNTPGQIGRGVTAYVSASACSDNDRALVEQLLTPLGAVEPIAAERLMDVVTAVSGSGPAYVFLLAEVLAAVGEAEGLERDTARRLARQTVGGAGALMLESEADAATLRKQVTSPGGTTQAALDVLQAPDGLAPLLRRAVSAAARRSRELGKPGGG